MSGEIDRGWFRAERRVFEDEWLCDEPATKCHAWLDMVGMAAHRPTTLRLKHGKVHLDVGQLTASLGFLGERWKWPKAKVQRFIAALRKRSMIDTATDTGQMVVTVCNYADFQDASRKSDTGDDTGPIRDRYGIDTGPIRNTTTKPLTTEPKNQKEEATGLEPPLAPGGAPDHAVGGEVQERTDAPPGKKYAFEAGIVRLNQKDLDALVDAFSYVNVKAELSAMAEWLEEEVVKKKKGRWFPAAKNRLNQEDRKERARRSAAIGSLRHDKPEDFVEVAMAGGRVEKIPKRLINNTERWTL